MLAPATTVQEMEDLGANWTGSFSACNTSRCYDPVPARPSSELQYSKAGS